MGMGVMGMGVMGMGVMGMGVMGMSRWGVGANGGCGCGAPYALGPCAREGHSLSRKSVRCKISSPVGVLLYRTAPRSSGATEIDKSVIRAAPKRWIKFLVDVNVLPSTCAWTKSCSLEVSLGHSVVVIIELVDLAL